MDNGGETVYLEPQARRFRMLGWSAEISPSSINDVPPINVVSEISVGMIFVDWHLIQLIGTMNTPQRLP